MVILPVKPCSSRSRSNTRLLVCRCFFGRSLSAARIASIMPVNPSSFGRNGGFLRTYPGGTENFSIFETVRALMPNRSAAARSLIPSIITACRTRAYSSTVFIPRPLPKSAKDSNCRSFAPARPHKSVASVRDYCSGFHTDGASRRLPAIPSELS